MNGRASGAQAHSATAVQEGGGCKHEQFTHCCWCEELGRTWQDVLDMLRFFLLVALLCAALAEHADVCSERTPEHDQSAVRAAGNGGYFVFTEALDGYEAGRDYRGESWT